MERGEGDVPGVQPLDIHEYEAAVHHRHIYQLVYSGRHHSSIYWLFCFFNSFRRCSCCESIVCVGERHAESAAEPTTYLVL